MIPREPQRIIPPKPPGDPHFSLQGDPKEAIKRLHRFANDGDAVAQYSLALCYFEGIGVSQDAATGASWVLSAAKQGHIKAQTHMGRCFQEALGVARNAAEAVRYYRLAALQEDAEAQFFLGCAYSRGLIGLPVLPHQAFEWTAASARQGFSDAIVNLGAFYLDGFGVEADPIKAVELFTKAADLGNAAAQHSLANLYRYGEMLPCDPAKAADLYLKAALAGVPNAQLSIAVLYRDGIGVERDVDQALKWFTKAAENGEDSAFSGIGLIYSDGKLVPQDLATAALWFRRGAERMDPACLHNYAVALLEEEGIPRDPEEGMRLLEFSAAHGDFLSKHTIGQILSEGTLVPMNRIDAFAWFSLAMGTADDTELTQALESRSAITPPLTPEESIQASRRIDSLRSRLSRLSGNTEPSF